MYLLKIQNFQSLKDVTLPLKGFTALVGKSNRGKSAIVRTLRALLLNEWAAGYIRIGEKETILSIEIEEKSPYLVSILPGIDIKKISLKKPVNEYEIVSEDGTVLKYPKVGKGVPEKFELLNLSNIETEREDKFNLNFQAQLDPLFLITSTGVELTSFINKVFDISRLEKALREMKSENIQLTRAVESAENNIQEAIQEEKVLSGKIEALNAKIISLRGKCVDAETLNLKSLWVDDGIELWAGIENLRTETCLKEVCLSAYRPFLKEITHICSVGSELQTLSGFITKHEEAKQELIKKDKLLLPFNLLQKLLGELHTSFSCLADVVALQREQQKLQEVEDACAVFPLVQNILQKVQEKWAYCAKLQEGVSNLEALDYWGVNDLKSLQAHKELLEVYSDLRGKIVQDVPLCPICQQPFTKGDVHVT